MSKFENASDELIEFFDKVRNSTTIPQWVQFEVLCNNKQKQLYQINRLNDMIQTITDGVNFVVVINEDIFHQLEEDQQIMVLTECLAGVSVSDSQAVSLEKPNFTTFTGVLEKYGHQSIVTLHESVKSLFDVKKQQEDEEKALAKGKRGKKNDV